MYNVSKPVALIERISITGALLETFAIGLAGISMIGGFMMSGSGSTSYYTDVLFLTTGAS